MRLPSNGIFSRGGKEGIAAPGHGRFTYFYNIVIRADTDKRINLRYFIEYLLLISLREAACHHKALDRTIFQLRHFKNAVDRLALRILNKAAGVHNYEIRVIGIIREQIARILKLCEHDFRIHLVLGQPRDTIPILSAIYGQSFRKNRCFTVPTPPIISEIQKLKRLRLKSRSAPRHSIRAPYTERTYNKPRLLRKVRCTTMVSPAHSNFFNRTVSFIL